ncbi:unnamed protein product (macronuclear) [Paramecium tetraurelia]|uniref:Uncharacterized protein n=1 Tax=Paramecium tetraurelia TaxID=5888 RepID=A0BQA7_PARTE|nr:uncharacterized protein GSPATT00030953001 [Paramecium tetraurelia]CAK60724.1 unnamed protein product [Paramecium tetraurelia]|eukprot:XP_001428122.1 hypothetical protein (macronuclear) [Paramecium tetraurelia strain d4-2]
MQLLSFLKELRNRVAEMEAKNAEYQDQIEGLKQIIEEKDAKIKQLEDTLANLQNKPIKKTISKKKDKKSTKK